VSRAICLGEILIDCFAEWPLAAQGSSARLETLRSEVKSWLPLPGGSPANVACALVKLGSEADFIGAVGSDRWGDALLKLLDDMGVGKLGVQRRMKAPTRQVYMLSDEQGERSFMGFSEHDPTVFADAHLFADGLASERFINADFLMLGTLSLAYADTQQSVERAVTLAQQNQVPILLDVNWQPMFWPHPQAAPGRVYDLLKSVQFLKVSDSEAEWLFGTRSPTTLAKQLPHLKGILVTSRNAGCRYAFKGIADHVPAFDVDVEETHGASDAFTAGFINQVMQKGEACLLDRQAAREVVVYASAVSALTTTRPGAIAALPTPKEVEVFLYLNAPAD